MLSFSAPLNRTAPYLLWCSHLFNLFCEPAQPCNCFSALCSYKGELNNTIHLECLCICIPACGLGGALLALSSPILANNAEAIFKNERTLACGLCPFSLHVVTPKTNNEENVRSNHPTNAMLQSAAKNSLERIRTPELRQSKENKERFHMVSLWKFTDCPIKS